MYIIYIPLLKKKKKKNRESAQSGDPVESARRAASGAVDLAAFFLHVSGLTRLYFLVVCLGCRRGSVTQLGQLMVEFPLQPGLTRALLKAAALGCQELLLPLAAMLSVENIFIRPGSPHTQMNTRLRNNITSRELKVNTES